jgi:RNA polymerase sigma-70 factor (ECF subfamily)
MIENTPELLKRFIEGDASAFADLVERFQKRVYYLAFQMLGNHLDADEVVQESFVRIYKRRKDLAGVTNFPSFLTRIATNYSIDLLRKRKGHSQMLDDSASLPGEIQVELSRKVRTPDVHFKNKVLMEEIRRALATLPPRQKITALLHDVEGYSKSEISEILDCPEATVRSNLHIARKKLKKILEKRLADKE